MFTTAAGGATAGANEIKVNFNSGAGVKEGTITRQKGSKRFVVAEIGASDVEHTCTLATGKLPAALAAGEMSITVLGDDSETYGVSKITGRKVTLVAPSATGSNALDGTSIAWHLNSVPTATSVQMEEAGDDDVLVGVDDDDFTEDA
jgi:hypothetical protein